MLRVTDHGTWRMIDVEGRVVVNGYLVKLRKPIKTKLSAETIERLVRVKADWWLDEMGRRADVGYIRKRLEGIVRPYGGFEGRTVLDVGSGSGSSALTMSDAGAASVIGVEPDPEFVDLAKRRAQDEGVADRVQFRLIKNTTKLPFRNGAFDIVTFHAVIEHIPPALRAPILKEAYRCLRPGGLLVITETPNRAFPFDHHTTRLPLIPWLPLSISVPIARRFSRVAKRGMTKKGYIAAGIVGGSYWQVRKALPEIICLDLLDSAARRFCSRRTCSPITYGGLRFVEWILNALRLPLTAILPSLDLAFIKPAASIRHKEH